MNSDTNLPIVAIVGRMNVGKSTLFNRLAPKTRSITLDYPGVTRDVLRDVIEWNNVRFELFDTGGITLRKSSDEIFEKVRKKALGAVEKAAAVIFLVDGTAGLLAEEREIAQYLHRLKKPVIITINKADVRATQESVHEFLALGFGEPVLISAQHGTAINDLLDAVIMRLPRDVREEAAAPRYRVTLLGRPNVGKSSLMNMLLQEERSIVSDIAGTTREAISESIVFEQEHLQLTDTPGVRRSRAIGGDLEPLMVKSALAAARTSDIIVLMLDGQEGAIVDQELKLAYYVFAEKYRALIIAVNKNDVMTDQQKADLERIFDMHKHLINKVVTINISCKTGKNVHKLLPLIKTVWNSYSHQFSDPELHRILVSALTERPLMHQRQPLKVYNVQQVGTAPIAIALTVNEPTWFGKDELGFFENILRSHFDLTSVPVKFLLKKKK